MLGKDCEGVAMMSDKITFIVWFGWWLRMVVRRAEWFQEGRYMSKNEIWVDERTGGWLYR